MSSPSKTGLWRVAYYVVTFGSVLGLGIGIIVGASDKRGFWLTEGWAALAAVGTVGLATLLIDHLLRASGNDTKDASPIEMRRRGLKRLVIGADGRASTSKVQVVLWTYSVLFVLVFLLFYGHTW